MQDALACNLIDTSPCQDTGVKTSRRGEAVRPATAGKLEVIAAAMPARYQALIRMAAWLAMPFSALGELLRKDVDLHAQVVRVRRAVALINRHFQVTTPKSTLGIRDIPIPHKLAPIITAHLL